MQPDIFIPYEYLDGEEKSLEKILSIMGKSEISELFPDAVTIKPESWSEYYHEVTTTNPYKNEDDSKKETITLQLYREVEDGDEYSGHLTFEWFWEGVDDGGDFGGCIDAGLPKGETVCLDR
jgi:hypothetical protein